MTSRAELGKRLRAERLKRSLTLKEVESLSKVSATHVSQIERGITWPTVHALQKIATALDKKVSYFLEETELPDICKIQGDGATMVISENPKVVLRSLTNSIPGGNLHFYMLIGHPDTREPRIHTHTHEGDECGCVVSGEIDVRVGDQLYRLKEGESIHFPAAKPHGIRNVGDQVSRSIWAATSLGM